MANSAQVETQVRFALSQLPAHNAHHVFEEICRKLTAQFICSNVLPATGPVSAGGDQGRDFETFRTYLRNELGPTGAFLALVSQGTIAFICTTQKENVVAKVAADVEKVFASGQSVHEIKAFTHQSVSVGARHKLQKKVQATHKVQLDLFDAEAISELLAKPQGFWIAEQFLSLPAEISPPRPPEDEDLSASYVELRGRWREKGAPNSTLGDLIDLKAGLREASFQGPARNDLPFWLDLIRKMLSDPSLPPSVRQRARYELIVASLRGISDMKPVDEVVREFLNDSLTESEPARLQDAQVLLQYVVGAAQYGATEISATELATWNADLKKRVKGLLLGAHPHRRASLLYTLGWLGMQRALTEEQLADARRNPLEIPPRKRNISPATVLQGKQWKVKDFVDLKSAWCAWTVLAEGLEETPLFPVDSLSDLLQIFAPVLVDHAEWRPLVELIDSAIERVSGRAAVAERAQERAIALFRANRRLDALEEFHLSRIGWWSGDTIRESLLASLMIAGLYLELRLPQAAKMYALAAAYVGATRARDDLVNLVPRALMLSADADFAAGAWCSATEQMEVGMEAQYALDGNDPDRESNALGSTMLNLSYIAACARDVDPDLASSVRSVISSLGIQASMGDLINSAHSEFEGNWEGFCPRVINSPPFSDLGKARIIRFSCLGLDWTLESGNDNNSVRVAERFAAAAQVLLAALAREDLCLLPTGITVRIEKRHGSTEGTTECIAALPSNDGRLWLVRPAPAGSNLEQIDEELLEMLSEILFEVSLLQESDFLEAMERAFQRSLGNKLSFPQPYDEFAAIFSEVEDRQIKRGRFNTPWDCLDGLYAAHEDLRWNDGPGPTFSQARAKQLLHTRYRNLGRGLRVTTPALLEFPHFREIIERLRSEGWLDWHILLAIFNVMVLHRYLNNPNDPRSGHSLEEIVQAAIEPESERAMVVPAQCFTWQTLQRERQNSMLSLLKHWKLELHQTTPDFPGIQRLLASRYGYWNDDVAHVNPFPSTGDTE